MDDIVLLDHFAGCALQGLLTKYELKEPEDQDTVCKMAYQLANQMLEEKKNYKPNKNK